MKEVCIIFQALSANKPKYTRAMLRKLHIFDTKVADQQLQKAYLANTLINLCELSHTFYKINFLLECQNSKFKYFCTDRRLFL